MPMTLSARNHDVITDFKRGHYFVVKELYEEHYPALLDFASQLIINKEEAHHIVQETFIKLFGMRDRFHQLPDIKAFLYITVRNICLAYIRADKKNGPGSDAAWYNQALIAIDRFDESLVRSAVLRKMQEQVMDLPAQEQIVFRLLFYDRLTIQQAAEESGLTTVMVAQRRISGIRLLREKLITSDLFSIPLFIYFIAVGCGSDSL
ncbi:MULTISPECIES: RNA polymerase sigma factor [Niastella]|uniref:Sigma-70 family RNA polymerase sigma factor n=1 Tax=Niastella soli TaxID=2821487 RepID=A0ABS3YZ02_9BACT|nr:sigma-70 family RNA polymerase sigma factor [Niastella soli]MBO9203159.1 sigma-70 family RNA polymerase sigma factor [Niastella soli]